MDGILLFNKPILWTSHDAVDFIRQRSGQRSVGHAGTLDPLATGLLVILLGRATKLSEELGSSSKDYAGSLTLGFRTDTQDLEGKIISTGDWMAIKPKHIKAQFSKFTGTQFQTPPAYSAVKKNGKNLYQWARAGIVVEREAREVTVSSFLMTAADLPDIYFSLSCSKGTYVRALCDDLGERLGCGAVLSSLVRTRSGTFYLKEALDASQILKFAPKDIENCLVKKTHENISQPLR